MTDTPETDILARGNHVVPTEFAQQLERERDEAREDIEMLGIRYAAAEMHHETNMQEVTEQRDRLAEALEYILGIGLTQKTKAKAETALQTTQSNE